MRFFVYIVVFFCFWTVVIAQNFNTFYSYPVNLYSVNPAYTGAETYIPLQIGVQRSNTGVQQGALNFVASGHVRYRKKVKNETKKEVIAYDVFRPASVRNSVTNRYLSNEKTYRDSVTREQKQADSTYKEVFNDEQRRIARLPFHGFGGLAKNEFIAQNSVQTSFNFSYALHLYVAPGVRLSFGAGIGMQNMAQTNTFTFRESGDAIADNFTSPRSAIAPDANVGTMLIGQKYYFGIAAYSLLGQPQFVQDIKSINNNLVINAMAGYKIKINKNTSIIPGVLVRYSNGLNLSMDFNARVLYKAIWAGPIYRHNEAIGIMAGLNLDKTWDISYAYGFTTASALKKVSYGSHEIIVGYRLKNKNYGLKSKFF